MARHHCQLWAGQYPCSGTWRNGVCVLGLPDLATVLPPAAGCHIVNKFRSDLHPAAAACLVELQLTADSRPALVYSKDSDITNNPERNII